MKAHQDSIGFLIADLSRLMRRSFGARLEGSCVTHAQAKVLVHVACNEGIRQVELAALLEVQPITLARLIDQLEESGLVKRSPDPADRRAYRLVLTKAAAPQLAAIERVAESIHADALRDLTKQEIAALVPALMKMRDNLGHVICKKEGDDRK